MRTEDISPSKASLAYRSVVSLVSVLCFGLLFLPLTFAAPADGVRCPNGYETQFDSANKTLRCQRSQTTFRPAVCDPKFDDHVVYRVNRGQDSCVRVADATASARSSTGNDARGRAVVCSFDPSEKVQWSIDVDPNSQDRDRCKATHVEWIYPSQQ